MKRPKVCILRSAGTNCDKETAFAFEKAGALVELAHVNSLVNIEASLNNYQILAIPGGFSYGDDAGAGKILANELKFKLTESLKNFIRQGKLIIGICNGFQILVKSGLLPGNGELKQEASLIINDSGKFEGRWVYLKSQKSPLDYARGRQVKSQKCIWTKDLPEIIYLPVAHGEGKFICRDKAVLGRLKKNHQVVFQYCAEKGEAAGYPYNPNGSVENIAGICDETGRVFGLMPHPERHMERLQHPRWTGVKNKKEGDGLQIFKNGVEYARKNL